MQARGVTKYTKLLIIARMKREIHTWNEKFMTSSMENVLALSEATTESLLHTKETDAPL